MDNNKEIKEYNKKTEVVNIRISKQQKKQLNAIGEKLKLKQSSVLRLAIENIINEHNINNEIN